MNKQVRQEGERIQEIIDPGKHADTGAYASAIEAGDWIFVSGQGPLDLNTGKVVPGTLTEETRLTLQNIQRVLEAAGCSLGDVVKSTCYLQDINAFEEFDQAYSAYFSGGPYPARTTVGGDLGGIKIEIDVVAYRGR